MLIAKEATFRPVAAILPFDYEKKVLAQANNMDMGLAAYLYTRDLNRVMRLTDRLEYVMVAVNTSKFTGRRSPLAGGNSPVQVGKARSTGELNIYGI